MSHPPELQDALRELQLSPELAPTDAGWQGFLAALSARLLSADEREQGLFKRLEQSQAERAEADAAVEAARIAKTNFLATMSHELRTPLNGILGMCDLLLSTELSAQQREYAEVAHQSALLLLGLVDEVLDFPRLEAGKVTLERRPFELRATLEGLSEMLAPRAREKGLEFAALIYREVPLRAIGDPIRLRQLMLHLADNAIKFTQSGEVLVRAKAVEQSGDSFRLVVEVVDTGIGVPSAEVERIFELFAQGDESSTRRYGGIGLGLATAKRLVELMDGKIGVESTPGRGSTFWFSIPLQRAEATPESHTPSTSLLGRRALVVDDNTSNLAILHHQLSGWGLLSLGTSESAKALQLLIEAQRHGQPFDLVLIDRLMPHLNGLELGRAIQGEPALAGLPMILLAAKGLHDHAEEARSVGFSACLSKPFQAAHLYECIANVLETSAGAAPTLAPPRPQKPAETTLPRLLVVEDNAVNQKVVLSMLGKLGYAADVVPDGREALQAVRNSAYDAVLMDCQMPVMDGFKATQEIRRGEEPGQRLPIIALTAFATEGARELCLDAGMDDYLTKPLNVDSLKGALERWLKPGEAPEAPRAAAPAALDDTCLDPATIDGLRQLQQDGEPDILAELAEVFFEEAPQSVEAIRQALAAADAPQVRRAAHTLKGCASNIGAKLLAASCGALERAATEGVLTGGDASLQAIEAELAKVNIALRALAQAGV